ncbi:hypothetical protein D3C71_1645590 [compost metagenome]
MRLVAHGGGFDLRQRLASEVGILAGAVLFDEEVPDARRSDLQRLFEVLLCLKRFGIHGRHSECRLHRLNRRSLRHGRLYRRGLYRWGRLGRCGFRPEVELQRQG